MGREWLYKTSGGSGDGSGCGVKSSTEPVKSKTRKQKKNSSSSSSSAGCMSAIFKLFDIQHHQFRFHHPSFISQSSAIQQSHFPIHGVEAPRNSLESPEFSIDVAPSPSTAQQQPNLKLTMGGIIEIKTKRAQFTEDLSSECSGSPGTKTPNLVARLMGLDLLPEYSTPRPSSSSTTPVNSHYRTRSLPTTPRISTASRRSTDNDYHHRLSLQIDKENYNSCRIKTRSELPVTGSQDDNCRSQYAKQIANQVKERISRRLGTDITNTISGRVNKEQRRDSNLVLLKPKKQPPRSSSSSPPRPSLPAAKAYKKDDQSIVQIISSKVNSNSQIKGSCLKKEESIKAERPQEKQVVMKDKKIRRLMASERYDLRLKKKKKSILGDDVVNVKNTKKFLSVKKEMTSSSSSSISTTRLPQKQVSLASILPSNLNSSYNPNDSVQHSNVPSTSGQFSDHFDYIATILHHCGINIATPISDGQWHSPSHPLHPSIFHRIEKLHHRPTPTTAKRKMIFELVNELLAEILKPYTNVKVKPCGMCGSDLIRKLCERIGSIPAADCKVMKDIDGLIERDMGRSMQRLWLTAYEAEAAEIVTEIEGEILETLVREMVIGRQVLTG